MCEEVYSSHYYYMEKVSVAKDTLVQGAYTVTDTMLFRLLVFS